MIHQELHPIPYRNVMDNIWLGRYPTKGAMIDEQKMYRANAGTAERSRNQRQSARADHETCPSRWCRPSKSPRPFPTTRKSLSWTSPLPRSRKTKWSTYSSSSGGCGTRGAAIIYISHKMEEILEISDEVTIMRDGKSVGTWPARGADDRSDHQAHGRPRPHAPLPAPGKRARRSWCWKWKTSPASMPRSFQNVSLTLRKGEILGVGGLMGAQRTELLEAAVRPTGDQRGYMRIDGMEVKATIARHRDEARHGAAHGGTPRHRYISHAQRDGKHRRRAQLQAYVKRPLFALDDRTAHPRYEELHRTASH